MAAAAPRSIRTTVPGGVRIELPARRHALVVVALGAWLAGWAAGEVGVLRQVAAGTLHGARLAFALVWLAGWTLGGAFALAIAAWSLGGREAITVAGGRLALRRAAFGLGRTRTWPAREISNVRVVAAGREPTPAQARLRARLGSPDRDGKAVAFDVGGATERVGAGLSEEEAESIAALLRERVGVA